MKSESSVAYRVFFTVGLVIFILGISNQPAFMGIGIAFFVIGLVGMARERARNGVDDVKAVQTTPDERNEDPHDVNSTG